MSPVTIRTEPARRLAAIAHRGPYDQIKRAFERLGGTLFARGLAQPGARNVRHLP